MTAVQPPTVYAAGEPSDSEARIQFSIVTAVYNVARYLDEFIESVESQTFPRDRFEVIAVNDGSTDDSLEKLRAWEDRRPGLVTIVSQENAGLPSARNAGFPFIRGAWVTFADPDDRLAPDYLSEVAAFLDEHPTASMIATARLILNDVTGEVTDAHPLRRHFRQGNQLRDISHYPEYFHGSAPAAFFPLVELRRQNLRFDPRLRPNFEDGHFCCHYLLGTERPAIGFVATAHYHYRKRRDQSSTLQGSFADAGRFTTVLEFGFLDALKAGARASADGRAPEWLQNIIIYELSWYFSSDEAGSDVLSAAIGAVADRFHELISQILGYLDRDVVARFVARPMKPIWIDVLLHGYEGGSWHQDSALISSLDAARGLVRISYRFSGEPPREELLSGGRLVQARNAKVRAVMYQGRALLSERIVWMSSRRSVRVRLDGRDLDLQFTERRRNHVLGPADIEEGLSRQPSAAAGVRPRQAPIAERVVRRLARTRLVRRYFRNAWVLMDRIAESGDSAERLFDYLRARRPDINAWFVVAKEAPDWRRLRRAHGFRVLAHGSLRWKFAMANCQHLISSHVDVPIVKPPALRFFRPRWRFTFLQHGVIKDDLSGWLNPKPIDLFITSTPQEYASVVADDTPYVFTTKEVKLTGLPRFDRLRDLGDRLGPEDRDLVLIAPTWRVRLLHPLQAGQHRRAIAPAFLDSAFARNWLGLLQSDDLAAICTEQELTLGFLPHPELQPALAVMPLPNHVRALTFADNDVQELFARSAVMVTDYSSMAFNAAYIDRPVVYFQFDADEVSRGAHIGRAGYFDWERDGFGPVAFTLADAVARIAEILRTSRSPAALYQARINATFPTRDGRCCSRVTDEIERLTRPTAADEAGIAIRAPLVLPPHSAD